MSDTDATNAALPPQTAGLETPGDAELQETPQPSAKDQERSRKVCLCLYKCWFPANANIIDKAKYRAAIETIHEERGGLDEADIDAAEKRESQ